MDGKNLSFTEPISSGEFAAKAEELGALGQRFLQNLEERTAEYREKIREYSYGTYSTLHRGFYCPSAAGDIVVGNQSRGRIRKKAHAGDPSLSFRYGFRGDGELIQVNSIYNGKITGTEYLFVSGEDRIGVTVSIRGNVTKVSQERTRDGRLLEYGLMYWNGVGSSPTQYQCERFAYDDEGLKAWNLQVYLPIPPDSPVHAMFHIGDHELTNLYVTFERENGFLKEYTAFDVKDGKISADGGRKYMVRRKRRA